MDDLESRHKILSNKVQAIFLKFIKEVRAKYDRKNYVEKTMQLILREVNKNGKSLDQLKK